MIVDHNREKLLNTVIYFLENTSWYGITKLFKLLYFLDFEHYKQTGRSVTGQDYFAWRMGPVPAKLREEIDNPEEDFLTKLDVDIQSTKKGKTIYLKPKSNFDSTHFTRRELRLLKEIATQYAMNNSTEMVEYTHLDTQPWHQVWEVEKRCFDKIPYEYSLINEEKKLIKSIVIERLEMINNY